MDSQVEIDEEQAQAVETGLSRLAFSGDLVVAAYGIISLSSWYTSTSRSNQTRDEWKKVLHQLIRLLSPPEDASDESHRHTLSQYPYHDVLIDLAQTLAVEVSHWRWELSKQEMVELLELLVSLYCEPLIEGPARGGMSAALAVLALLFNDYPEITPQELEASGTHATEGYLQEAIDLYQKKTKTYNEQHGDFHKHTSKPQRAKRRPWRAQSTAILCAMNRGYLERYSEELMLFGLAGLLDSFAEVQLGEAGATHPIAQLVAAQLIRIPITQSQTTTLPWVLPSTFDLRLYTVDVITRIVSPSPLGDQRTQLCDEDKAALLQYLSERSIWAEFGHQIIMPMIKLLNCANTKLQTQCLVALREYCLGISTFDDESESYPNPIDWRFIFSFDIPYQLVKIVEGASNNELESRAVDALDSIVQIIPNADEEAIRIIRNMLKRLILDGLFETFAIKIVCKAGDSSFGFLRKQMVALPEILKIGNQADVQIFQYLQDFCRSHNKESGFLALLLFELRSKVDVENPA
ncbi:unnamed protein product [Rhizoctonia solani]|uniref:Uncharacterized protein n=1 Tax=Rhizoctonia solani TaxID=456999 RepID=A0A8H3DY62_9AGAM|nr:unnamed protein product [Rhizoctonia solani]